MKKFYLLTNFFLLIVSTSFAQAPVIEWQNTIGGSNKDFGEAINQTSDGGYIVGGSSRSNTSGDKAENSQGSYDYWILKLNSFGIIQWQNTIGGNNADYLQSITETSDGGYILGGYSSSDISGDKTEASYGETDYWIVKINSTGSIEWQKTIGGDQIEFEVKISQTSDGGYIVGGESLSNISGNKTENSNGDFDYWVVKLDNLGNIEWQNTIGGSGGEKFLNVQQTNDGGYILGGHSRSNISGDKTENSIGFNDYWLVKLNNSGTIQWQNTIGGTCLDALRDIRETSDNGFIIAGSSCSNISGDKTEDSFLDSSDYWVIKTDNLGNILWQNTIGGLGVDEVFSIDETNDNGFVIAGWSTSNIFGDKTEDHIGNGSFINNQDFWIVKIDDLGNVEWDNTIGGTDMDRPEQIHLTNDGGFIIVGYSVSNISGDKTENSNGSEDYWIVKLEAETLGLQEYTLQNTLIMYPNPVHDILEFDAPEQINKLTIHTINGSLIKEIESFNSTSVDVSDLSSGIYLIKLFSGDKTITKKFIKK